MSNTDTRPRVLITDPSGERRWVPIDFETLADVMADTDEEKDN